MTASIRIKNLCLDVPTFVQPGSGRGTWLRTLLGAAVGRPRREFRRLLDDVTFSITEGDRLALIGRNGAGKTTLLRVLTGAYTPSAGMLKIFGTRQALLNISLGFSPQATLIENVYLRGTAMGLSGHALHDMVEPVLEFAELQEKAQDRMYTLSSGQRMRLGFAIATAVNQDIILMDEWLGAGDAGFLERAKVRMDDRVHGSKIVVLASHNTKLLEQLCNKALLLEDGKAIYFGEVDHALALYKQQIAAEKAAAAPANPVEQSGSASDVTRTTTRASAQAEPAKRARAVRD